MLRSSTKPEEGRVQYVDLTKFKSSRKASSRSRSKRLKLRCSTDVLNKKPFKRKVTGSKNKHPQAQRTGKRSFQKLEDLSRHLSRARDKSKQSSHK